MANDDETRVTAPTDDACSENDCAENDAAADNKSADDEIYGFIEPADDDRISDAPAKGRGRGIKRIFNRENFVTYRYLGFAFLVPALTMWLIYIAMQVYPFGEESVLVLDLNGQYVYFFEELREIVLGGESFLYSFGRALGGEFMGIYAYYLASPFSFIVCLFPKENITEALLLMFLLKTGLCGLTFGIYAHYKTETGKLNRVAVVMFSTFYALTAYAVVQQHNTMWIDNLIMLPLIVMGMERLIKYHRFRLFVVTLTWALMSNFYIGMMMCIFVFFYFFLSYLTVPKDELNPSGERHHFLKSLLRIAGCAVLVLAMSSVILFSASYALSFGKTTFSNPSADFTSKFDLLELISKLFIGSYDTVRPAGLPFVYCGTLVLILLPIYFFIKEIPFREKVSAGITVIFFVFSFSSSTIDLIWHGGQKPNWLNYRYSFILCFFMVFFAYRAFQYIKQVDIKLIIADVAMWVLILAVLQTIDDYDWIEDYATVWLSLAFFAVYLIFLRMHMTLDAVKSTSVALASIAVLECFVGGLLNLTSLDSDVVYSSRTSYRSFIDRVQPIVDMVQDGDSSFYRMDKTVHRKTNDPLALGYYGLSNSTSTLNEKTIEFLNYLGLSSKSHWSKYLGGTPVLDMLLDMKYVIIEDGDEISSLYNLVYEYDPEGSYDTLYAYENPYFLSIAFGVSEDTLDYVLENDDSPFVRMNELVSAMTGLDDEIYAPIAIDDTSYTNATLTFTSNHRVYTSTSDDVSGRVTYTFTATQDGNIYCYFPSDYARECDLYLNGSKFSTYFGNETCCVIDLGYYTEGETVEVQLRMTDYTKLYIMSESTYFYCIDEDALDAAYAELSESLFEIEEYTADSFTGTITVAEGDELIYTSIPYDEGWVITVDGVEVQPISATGEYSTSDNIFEYLFSFVESLFSSVFQSMIEDEETVSATKNISYYALNFYCEAGTHTITLSYEPECISYGVTISLLGVFAFAVVCVVDFINRRRRGFYSYKDVSMPDAVEIDLGSENDEALFDILKSGEANEREELPDEDKKE
ncbi:MAG: YfhO family protein [Firmicutes bacterium]|nr:YfhO family protein [Bacillota bacterium]